VSRKEDTKGKEEFLGDACILNTSSSAEGTFASGKGTRIRSRRAPGRGIFGGGAKGKTRVVHFVEIGNHPALRRGAEKGRGVLNSYDWGIREEKGGGSKC